MELNRITANTAPNRSNNYSRNISPQSEKGQEIEAEYLDAMNSYGRAYVNYNSPVSDKFRVKKLTEEEYNEYKNRISERIKTMPENVQKNLPISDLTKENIFIADKIISEERLYKNDGIMQVARFILYGARTAETAQAKIDVADKILSDERLYNNENFKKQFGSLISNTITRNAADAKIKTADLILSDEKLYGNETVMKNAADLINSINNEQKEAAAEKILADKRLFDNPDFMKTAPDILSETNTFERCEIADKIFSDEKFYTKNPLLLQTVNIIKNTDTLLQKEFIDLILSDERIYGNAEFMKNIGTLTGEITVSRQKDCAKQIFTNEQLFTNETLIKHALSIISHSKTPDQKAVADRILSDEKLYSNPNFMGEVSTILFNTNLPSDADAQIYIIDKTTNNEELSNNRNLMNGLGKIIKNANTDKLRNEISEILDKTECFEKTENAKQKVLAKPELYVNGEYSDKEDLKNEVNKFFETNYVELLYAANIFDEEALNNILRMRFSDAANYLKTLYTKLNADDRLLLKELTACKKITNEEETPLTPKDKTDLLYVAEAYNIIQCDKTKLQNASATGKIDFTEINIPLYEKLQKKCNLTQEEIRTLSSNEGNSFDTKYLHLLVKETMNSSGSSFKDIIKNAASDKDFKTYISDETNEYGKINENTAKLFAKSGMNYEKWLNPPAGNDVIFKIKDKNNEKLLQCAAQITEDIEALRKTNARKTIDKQYSNFIKDDKIVIPAETACSREKLYNFAKNCLTQFDGLFKRAEKNINTPEKKETAALTLTVKSHLLQRLKDIEQTDTGETKKTNDIDLTIKMWDRQPKKDIFQGNYSTCCIGMNETNGRAMPHYLLNSAYNMIELKDNKTGKIIGNSLCYFVKEENGEPAVILDNIEIKNNAKPSDEAGIKLRSAIAEFADKTAKEITGKDDIPVYMSGSYNDVPCDDLPKETKTLMFLGDINCKEIYMDLYGGWTDKFTSPAKIQMLRLK